MDPLMIIKYLIHFSLIKIVSLDLLIIKWMFNIRKTNNITLERASYAGWNTNGNTLGTIISNSVLLHLFGDIKSNGYFNTQRILEDMYYQALSRQELTNYVYQAGDSVNALNTDLVFYDRYSYKILNSYYAQINTLFQTPYQLQSIYYPWNRTFEIGFSVQPIP